MNLNRFLPLVALSLVLPFDLAAQNAGTINPIPPRGVTISASDRSELEAGVAELGQQIEALRTKLARQTNLLALLPDVQIYHKAVDWALRYNEFFRTNETRTARTLLQEGTERAKALVEGQAPWTTATGLVVRAYQSRIDGSVQPYGLVVPPSFRPNSAHKYRLDFWFHGRGEQLSELSFVSDRQRNPGEFVPPDAIVVHLYGRYCNANRFAGEMDLFETWDHLRKFYPIDDNRVVVRGFSMGGASCWQFATHYPSLWAAAAPGAGFSETVGFLRLRLEGPNAPPAHEQKLWHLYDSIDYAVNLFNCPTVAYSGEIDGQKQAADMMAKALAKESIEMTHIIGPQTPHRYHPQSRVEINRRIDSIVALGRNPMPDKVKFATWTLRYNQSYWLTIDALGQHWEQGRVEAELDRSANTLKATTTNVTALTFSMPSGYSPFDITRKVMLQLDRQTIEAPAPTSDRSWNVSLVKTASQWTLAKAASATSALVKKHGLQGPIDDAFLDSFIMVRPSGQPLNEKAGGWVAAEQAHAIQHWRNQFRGEARVKADTEITDADIASNNLVLWGDPSSNQLLAKIIDKLPIRWDAQGVHTADANYPSDKYVPVLIYPNPLNPNRYIVLNSGFTFREFDYLNNARQTPKLPDYAIIDISVPVSPRAPGGITLAGFFNEQWELPKK